MRRDNAFPLLPSQHSTLSSHALSLSCGGFIFTSPAISITVHLYDNFANVRHEQIWASGKSTVGAGAESKVHARNTPITIKDVPVIPGDIIFCDPLEGIVVIPQALIDQVIDLMPKLVAADDKVKNDVDAGSTVQAAFKKHRS